LALGVSSEGKSILLGRAFNKYEDEKGNKKVTPKP
jgi:hypothetical protein